MTENTNVSVLFVCLVNICRSPTADGVFTKMVRDAGLADQVRVDSAGTGAWHIGNGPDPRAIEAASHRGVDLTMLRARQATVEDFDHFDYVVAMDRSNFSDLTALRNGAANTAVPDNLHLFLEYASNTSETEVPDPYYGGDGGFDAVLDMIEDASAGLLQDIKARLGTS